VRTLGTLARRVVVPFAGIAVVTLLATPAWAGNPQDDTLIANDDEYTTPFNTPVALNVEDNDEIGAFWDSFFVGVLSPPAPSGTVDDDVTTFTPAAGFVGDVTFEYEICVFREVPARFSSGKALRLGEGQFPCEVATVTIHVQAPPATTTTTVAPATTVPPTTVAVQAAAAPTTVAPAAVELPRTGGASAMFLVIGLVIIGLGALSLAITRRTRRS
jgi:LPXTG-motif cell wall-anchored protein